MKRFAIFILLVFTFLSAAKSHGRQYRLERELKGYWVVSFQTKNDPWVERLWLQQRILYWSIASATAIFLAARRYRSHHSGGTFWFVILTAAFSMIVAFVVMGLSSAVRLAWNLSGGAQPPNQEWLRSAIWGSLGWWVLTAILISFLIFFRKTQAFFKERVNF